MERLSVALRRRGIKLSETQVVAAKDLANAVYLLLCAYMPSEGFHVGNIECHKRMGARSHSVFVHVPGGHDVITTATPLVHVTLHGQLVFRYSSPWLPFGITDSSEMLRATLVPPVTLVLLPWKLTCDRNVSPIQLCNHTSSTYSALLNRHNLRVQRRERAARAETKQTA